MFKASLICLSLLSPLAMAAHQRVVDIGFRDADQHIAIRLATQMDKMPWGSGLTSNSTGKNVPLNQCLYLQSALQREVERIQNPKVRADFDWIFVRSGYSSSPVTQFFPEFKALLERVNPQCAVQELPNLRDRLDPKKADSFLGSATRRMTDARRGPHTLRIRRTPSRDQADLPQICPRILDRLSLSGRTFFACSDHGLLVRARDLPPFFSDPRLADEFLAALSGGPTKESARRCPSCSAGMHAFQTTTFSSMEVDACRRCRVFWFDQGEWEAVRAARFEPLAPMPPNSHARSPLDVRPPDGMIEAHAAASSPLEYLGLPVAEGRVQDRNPSLGTYLLTFASFGFTATARRAPRLMERWMFWPSRPFAGFGLTHVTAMLTHADWWHWIGNAYFLWMVGPDLDEEEGPWAVLLMATFGALVGHFVYARLGGLRPTLGLSGGVSTMMVYWACRYPSNRVRLTFLIRRPVWSARMSLARAHLSVSAPVFTALFFLKDLPELMMQVQSPNADGGVNYVAHFAGAAVGLILWLVRDRES